MAYYYINIPDLHIQNEIVELDRSVGDRHYVMNCSTGESYWVNTSEMIPVQPDESFRLDIEKLLNKYHKSIDDIYEIYQ